MVAVVVNYLEIAAGPPVAALLVQYGPGDRARGSQLARGELAAAHRPAAGDPGRISVARGDGGLGVRARRVLRGACADCPEADLHQPNLAAGDLTVAAMFASGAAAAWLTRSVPSRRAALGDLSALLVAFALLVAAESVGSMVVLLSGAVIGGVAAATCYLGSLQVVNRLASSDRCAEVISSYLLMGLLGNALPVIGVGVLVRLDVCFSAAIALLTLMALVTGMKLPPRDVRRAA
jgi:hypothetical protein